MDDNNENALHLLCNYWYQLVLMMSHSSCCEILSQEIFLFYQPEILRCCGIFLNILEFQLWKHQNDLSTLDNFTYHHYSKSDRTSMEFDDLTNIQALDFYSHLLVKHLCWVKLNKMCDGENVQHRKESKWNTDYGCRDSAWAPDSLLQNAIWKLLSQM